MKRTDDYGTPIIDEPLLRLSRLRGAFGRWFIYALEDCPRYPLIVYLIYHRRPYAAHKRQVKWM